MTTRQIQLKPNATIAPCPQCGNTTHFTIHSSQVAEDGCEIWAVCQCGHAPPSEHHLEDVWGGVDDTNVFAALACWNDAFATN